MTRNIKVTILLGLLMPLSVPEAFSQEDSTSVARHKLARINVATTAEHFEAISHVNSQNDTLRYRLLKPIDYDPNKKYPLVVCLAGAGGRGDDNISQIAGCWPALELSRPENRRMYKAFVFVPQCPTGANWGTSLGEREYEHLSKLGRADVPSVSSLVFEVMKALETKYSIDTTRRYITGLSMGGYGTWHFILTHPKTFTAAIPICGGGNPELASNIKELPVWAFHGQLDKVVPVSFSKNMIAAIKASGGNPKYTEFPEAGHVSWPLAYDTPGLLDWLFDQQNEIQKETNKR